MSNIVFKVSEVKVAPIEYDLVMLNIDFSPPGFKVSGDNDFIVNWGDGTVDHITTTVADGTVTVSHVYTSTGTYRVKVTGTVEEFHTLITGTRHYRVIYVRNFDCIKTNTKGFSFLYQDYLTEIHGLKIHPQTTSFYYIFDCCDSLEYIEGVEDWDTSNITNMAGMFEQTKINSDLSGWDVSNVTDMSYMFSGCQYITTPAIEAWFDGSNPQITDHAQCFAINTARTNYGDIPSDWK